MRGTCQAAVRKCIHTSILKWKGGGAAHRPMNALGGHFLAGGLEGGRCLMRSWTALLTDRKGWQNVSSQRVLKGALILFPKRSESLKRLSLSKICTKMFAPLYCQQQNSIVYRSKTSPSQQ